MKGNNKVWQTNHKILVQNTQNIANKASTILSLELRSFHKFLENLVLHIWLFASQLNIFSLFALSLVVRLCTNKWGRATVAKISQLLVWFEIPQQFFFIILHRKILNICHVDRHGEYDSWVVFSWYWVKSL